MALASRQAAAAQYAANSDYDLVRDLVKAGLFIQACRYLIITPEEAANAGANTRFNLVMLQKQLDAAEQWYRANDPTGSGPLYTATSFEYSRRAGG